MKITLFLKKSVIVPALFTAANLEATLKKRLSTYDLTILEALILVGIAFESRDCRPSELSTNLHASRARVSQAIKKLVQKNLIERRLESEDARFIAIRLTARGKTISTKLVSVFDDINDRIENSIGAKSAESTAGHLFNLLGKL